MKQIQTNKHKCNKYIYILYSYLQTHQLLVLFLLLISLKSYEISCGINLDLGFKLPSINIRLEPKLPSLKITTFIKAKKSSDSGLFLSSKHNWDDQSSWIEDALDKTISEPWPSSETLVEKDFDISPEPWPEDWDRNKYLTDNTNEVSKNKNNSPPWPYPPSALPWAPWGFYPIAIIPYPYQPMVTTTPAPNNDEEESNDENNDVKRKRKPRTSTRVKIATAKFH